MINKNELRLGNLVNLRGHITEIQALKSDRCMALSDFAEYEDLQPIPLTEEWLLKFGFEPNAYGYVIGKDNFNIHIWLHDDGLIRDIELSSTMISGAYPKIENFKYVHQIQNLYYILFNEELTIKQP